MYGYGTGTGPEYRYRYQILNRYGLYSKRYLKQKSTFIQVLEKLKNMWLYGIEELEKKELEKIR
jgi:hypothetical protein